MTQDYDKPATEYFSKQQDYDKPAPEFFRKQGNQWTPVDSLALTSHPITPPPELVQRLLQLCDTHEHPGWHWKTRDPTVALLKEACQYGADQELEAFCEWLREAKNHGLGYEYGQELADRYRAARRPKPPSLKEQALDVLKRLPIDPEAGYCPSELDTIRRALEQLND